MVVPILADLVSKLNGAKNLRLKSVDVVVSKTAFKVVFLLQQIGVIKRFIILNSFERGHDVKLRVYLNYRGDGLTMFKSVKLVSKPGRPVHFSLKSLLKAKEGAFDSHIFIMSIKGRGIVLDQECLEHSLGGIPLISVEFF